MKKLIYPFVALLIIATSVFAVIKSQDWKIKEGYSIKFDAKDPTGVFTGLKGDIRFDETNLLSSKFDVTIDAASINTGNGMQNTHAKSEKWFDVAKYPSIKFTSDAITKTAKGYQAAGTLEMHGEKKAIIIPFTFVKTPARAVFNGSFDVNRLDFKIGEPGGKASEVIKLEISVPVSNS
jgi:polyisoprenoid-binding protein YceI